MHEYAPVDLDSADIDTAGDVVLVNYDGRADLARSLPVWAEMRDMGYVDTVRVVDNGSSDGSVAFVQESHPEVDLIANAENRGFTGAVNQGFEHVDADVAFLTTPDMVVTQSWCHRLIEALEDNPDRGAATGVILRPSGKVDGRGSTANSLFRFHPAPPQDEVARVDSGRGSGLLIDRSAFEEAGGIDEDLFIQWDEVSLTLNLRATGYETVFVPGALAWHCERAEYADGLEYYRARNLYLLAGRHLDTFDFLRVAVLNAGIHGVGHPVAALLGRQTWGAVGQTWRGAAEGIARAVAERIGTNGARRL